LSGSEGSSSQPNPGQQGGSLDTASRRDPSGAPEQPVRIAWLTELRQFDQCVDVQEAVWGYNPGDIIPRRMFLLASRIGGQVLGAYVDGGSGETMAGFAMALPGYRNGHAYLHSHMVGVLAEQRNRGIARALKLAQRDDALRRGFDLMEWTFDPLEIKNAYLNIARLGAITRRYERNFYGPSSSPLQGGLPTDRVYAEWWLRSGRVKRLLDAGTREISAPAANTVKTLDRVTVPAEIYHWKSSPEHWAAARELQARNADALQSAFARGFSVIGYELTQQGDGCYLLGLWDEAHKY
jgi:predicted GNAT superfamily acetyltransferase